MPRRRPLSTRNLLFFVVFLFSVKAAETNNAADELTQMKSLDQPPLSSAVDVEKRAIDAAADQNSDGKFQLYMGTIDGVRRMLFNEVDGGEQVVPTEVGGRGREIDQFGAYDDNTIVDPNQEKGIFIPRPYRPKDERIEEAKTTTTTTTTQAPTTRRPTLPPAPVQQPAPFRPAQPLPQSPSRPPFSQLPGRLPPPPQTRRPPIIPVHQTASRPSQSIQPFPPQPQPAFRPVQQQTFQPQPTFQQPFRQPFQSFQTPRPAPPSTPTPRPPFNGPDPNRMRTGVCANSIFYISTPLSGPSRLSFTHFAIAVTVDQCARTCHEFNCAIAHYNPVNGHCEFNPSTAFAIRNGQCPAWPSLHYRNNVVASEAVRIFCATCQRPRRRISNNVRGRFNLRQRAFDPRKSRSQRGRSRREKSHFSSSNHATSFSSSSSSRSIPVIHGVLLRQPQSKATGLSTSSFVGLTNSAETSKARGARNLEVDSTIPLQEEMEEVEAAHKGKMRSQ
ncbi:unnamed protein product, partial [Mesorhabditis belari]|uniref:Apple domain-containing protein n=1 Tax=Mesorhabditis belari TaxID=2138241 RepID=A0AAF3F647_9BILA